MLVDDKVIVNWEDNWADEMDLDGFVIMKAKDWNKFLDHMREIDYELIYNVGTNQEITYANGSEALNHFEMKYLSPAQAQVFEELNLSMVGFSGPEILDFLDNSVYVAYNYQPEYQPWDRVPHKPKKVSVSYNTYNWEKRAKELLEDGYEKTYTGKTGETWELKE